MGAMFACKLHREGNVTRILLLARARASKEKACLFGPVLLLPIMHLLDLFSPETTKLCHVFPIGREPGAGSHIAKVVSHEKEGANNLDLDHV